MDLWAGVGRLQDRGRYQWRAWQQVDRGYRVCAFRVLHPDGLACVPPDALQYAHRVRWLDEGTPTPRDGVVGVGPDDGHRLHLVARQGQQPPGVLQQDDPLARDLSRKLPVLLDWKR